MLTPLRDAVRGSSEPVAPKRAARRRTSGFWWLKFFLLLCAIAFVLPVIGVMNVNDLDARHAERLDRGDVRRHRADAGRRDPVVPFTIDAWRSDAGRWLRGYAMLRVDRRAVVSGYLSAWGMIGFRPWNF